MLERLHPTAERLITTVSEMLDGDDPQNIIVDEVLTKSGVSRSAVYHHFGDYAGLIEATLLRRFSTNIAVDTAAIWQVTRESATFDEYWGRIRTLSALTQLPERAPMRAERARILSLAVTNQRLREKLAVEQERLTAEMGKAIHEAQIRGWVTPDLHQNAIAVLLQAYSLGRIVDDIATNQISNDEWIRATNAVLSTLEKKQ